MLDVRGNWGHGRVVTDAAAQLGIPCFVIDENIFADAYAVPRTIRNLIASTPVGQKTTTRVTKPRVSLVQQILETPLLQKPAWA
jgi:6-phosphogluconate dehydrogenase